MAKEPKPYSATPDELRAIDEALAEPPPTEKEAVARVITAIICWTAQGDPEALARRIVDGLDRHGYEIRAKLDAGRN